MPTLQCDQCEKTFPSRQGLSVHKFRAHTKQGREMTKRLSTSLIRARWSKKSSSKVSVTGALNNLKQHHDLLIQIKNEYSGGVGVMWKRAFSEHPEWAQAIGFDGSRNFLQKLYYWSKTAAQKESRQLQKTSRLEKISYLQEASHRLQTPENSEFVESSEVNYCPKCGTPLKLEEAAAKAIKRMVGKGLDEAKIIAALSAMTNAVEKL